MGDSRESESEKVEYSVLIPGAVGDHRVIHPWDGGVVEPQDHVQGYQTTERQARGEKSRYGFGSPSNVSQEGF